MSVTAILLLLLVLLLLKGFFSGSEIALVSCDKVKLNARATQGNTGAKKVLELYKEPDLLLGTTLVGSNISTVALTTLCTLLFIEWFGARGDFYAFLALTPILLVFGEIVPKSVYQQKADAVAPRAIGPLRVFSLMFYPLIFVFSRLARLCARMVGGGEVGKNLFMTREQLRSVADMAARTSTLGAFDRGRIRRVIRFSDTTVGEAMVPIAEVTAIHRSSGMLRALSTVRRTGYNRLPVSDGNTGNIIGIATLTTWDLFDRAIAEKKLDDIMHPPHYVLQFQTIDSLLPVLRKRDDRMAVVVDEFGSAIGIITMEDIVEEVVGDIDVGYVFEDLPRRKNVIENLGDNAWLLDARTPIFEVNDALEIELSSGVSHTIGGLVMAQLGHIPKAGESITEMGYCFRVEEVTERAIVKLRAEPA
ncbi:MAG: hemolysin family protein [Gammaproteobacteria bacterium]|nr:hemolysin family protein [Gammaproteobacteria bacterium]